MVKAFVLQGLRNLLQCQRRAGSLLFTHINVCCMGRWGRIRICDLTIPLQFASIFGRPFNICHVKIRYLGRIVEIENYWSENCGVLLMVISYYFLSEILPSLPLGSEISDTSPPLSRHQNAKISIAEVSKNFLQMSATEMIFEFIFLFSLSFYFILKSYYKNTSQK